MLSNDTRKILEAVSGGAIIEGQADTCTAIRNHLCTSFATSKAVKRDFEGQSIIKKKQEELIIAYCQQHNLWLNDVPGHGQYLTRGGEAKVYLHEDGRHVIKLNDGIYYATWLEYFNSLVLHNVLFKDTAYTFEGLMLQDGVIKAVIKQPFIKMDGEVDLADVRALLEFNGFENTRRQDYINKEFGLILEDMHDENVIVNSEKLFFIDTVFYTTAVVEKSHSIH